jgi:hypothetical protein
VECLLVLAANEMQGDKEVGNEHGRGLSANAGGRYLRSNCSLQGLIIVAHGTVSAVLFVSVETRHNVIGKRLRPYVIE